MVAYQTPQPCLMDRSGDAERDNKRPPVPADTTAMSMIVKRWLLGVRIFLYMIAILIAIQVWLLVALAPSLIVFLGLTNNGELVLDTVLDVALFSVAIAYAVLAGPVVLTWFARWWGLPVWERSKRLET